MFFPQISKWFIPSFHSNIYSNYFLPRIVSHIPVVSIPSYFIAHNLFLPDIWQYLMVAYFCLPQLECKLHEARAWYHSLLFPCCLHHAWQVPWLGSIMDSLARLPLASQSACFLYGESFTQWYSGLALFWCGQLSYWVKAGGGFTSTLLFKSLESWSIHVSKNNEAFLKTWFTTKVWRKRRENRAYTV